MFASIILAGGDSSRIGENKALLKIQGKTLIELIVDKLSTISSKIYIVTHDKDEYYFLKNVEVVEDYPVIKNEKPVISDNSAFSLLNLNSYDKPRNILNAIYTGLDQSEYEYNFVCACDMPNLNLNLINYMYSLKAQYDIVIPAIENKPITLHTFYRKNNLEVMKKVLDKGNKQVKRIFRDLNVKYIPEEALRSEDPDLKAFFHIKTPLDYILTQTDY